MLDYVAWFDISSFHVKLILNLLPIIYLSFGFGLIESFLLLCFIYPICFHFLWNVHHLEVRNIFDNCQTVVQSRAEWSSWLRCCNKNWKVSGSNPTRSSAGLRNPTSLQNSWWPSGQNCRKCRDQHKVNEAVPSRMSQSLPWDSQIAVKKNSILWHSHLKVVIYPNGLCKSIIISLFHRKITASVTKSSHQDRGSCYLPLPIFF